MNITEWAEKLNGRQYRDEVTYKEMARAKADGVLIVFGHSDDLMEFRGAISDEAEAWDGGVVKITPDGEILVEEEAFEDLDEWPKWNSIQVASMPTIKAIWAPKGKDGLTYASWLIDSVVAHASFDIFADGELYCRGAVFNIKDLKNWGGDNFKEVSKEGYIVELAVYEDFSERGDKADFQPFSLVPNSREIVEDLVELLNNDQFRDCYFRIKPEGNS